MSTEYLLARITVIDKVTGQPRPIYFGKCCRVELLEPCPDDKDSVPQISYAVRDGAWRDITEPKEGE
jgi:hypothetical protein